MWGRRVAWASLFALAAGVAVTAAAPAAYAATGVEYVTAATAYDSTSPKSLAITCPAGKVPINGGAYLTGAVGSVTIRQIVPLQLFGSYFLSVVAEEDPDGYSGSWVLSAIAVCVPSPAGLSYVSASVTDPSSAWATASCGAKRVIGGGYIVSATASMMASGVEIDSRNRAYLSAETTHLPGSASSVTGTAVAVCADPSALSLRQLSTSSPINSDNGKSVTTQCPPGTQVVGVGGDLYWYRHDTVIDDFTITPQTNSVTVTGFEDELGNPDAWAVDAYALCAI